MLFALRELRREELRQPHMYLNGRYYEKPDWMQQWSVVGYEIVNEKTPGGRQQVFARTFYD